ncbi:hypothetical protein [Nocardia asteroides]|uniref:hypothetical protein n=1 Tax=Nocardia asteroides TaxID=1824 RepID=UPI001E29527D|nr:hypothetical protein [Nocardia asteroides]UGT55163.1 hypothetical protein LTT85_32035 [Nocardia asteroides]
MRSFITEYMSSTGSLGSPAMDIMRMLLPVRPGDVLLLRVTVVRGSPVGVKNRSRVHGSGVDGWVRCRIEVTLSPRTGTSALDDPKTLPANANGPAYRIRRHQISDTPSRPTHTSGLPSSR